MKTNPVLYLSKPTKPGQYVYLFSIDDAPSYVGKGTGKRLFQHEQAARYHARKTRWQRVLAKAIRTGARVSVEVVAEGMSVEEANALEVCLISGCGRRDLHTGPLYNRTAGGDGLTREDALRVFAEPMTRRKLIRARQRTARDADFRARLSIAQRRAWADPAIRARRVAINRATLARPGVREKQVATCAITNRRPEVRALRSAAAKAMHRDPAYRLKFCEAMRREVNRPERKELARQQMRERNEDPEYTRRRLAGIKRYWAELHARSHKPRS